MIRDGVRRRGAGLFALIVLCVPAITHASLSVDTIADCTVGTSSPLGPCPSLRNSQSAIDENSPWTGTSVTASASNGHAGTLSQAYALASYGTLKITGHAEAVGGIPSSVSNMGSSTATAAWNDQINISSAGYASGTSAVLTVNFAVGGGFTRNGETSVTPGAFDNFAANTQATWDVYLWDHSYSFSGSHNGSTFLVGGYEDNWINGAPAPGIFGGYSFSAPILLGETFGISMDLYGFAAATAYGQDVRAWSDFDLGQSAYWGGIADVTVDGASVPFSLTSQSGHDWTQSSVPSAVPLPAAVWLFGSALLGLLGASRRKI